MKIFRLFFWISTLALCAIVLMTVVMFLLDLEAAKTTFTTLGFPDFLVIPLIVAKVIGLVFIVLKKPKLLERLSYLAFLILFVIAFVAHLLAKDGELLIPILSILLLAASYVFEIKAYEK